LFQTHFQEEAAREMERESQQPLLFLSKTRVGGGLSISIAALLGVNLGARDADQHTPQREETAAWAEISPQVASSAATLENLLISARHSVTCGCGGGVSVNQRPAFN
jgi:hypothetical protein